MSYQRDRDDFIALMATEGVGVTAARALLVAANRLQCYAELDCSSARAHEDQVPCPATRGAKHYSWCCCDAFVADGAAHATVPRFRVLEAQVERAVRRVCVSHGLAPIFGGDPRGYVLRVRVPSGRSTVLDGNGVGVPSQGFTSAQMERISR